MRNRTVGCKVTESEYEKLAALADEEGQRLGEWARAVLLERAEGRAPSAAEENVLGEVLALRTILLNAFYKLAQGEKLGAEEMQALIARADADKLNKARERLAVAAGGEVLAETDLAGVFKGEYIYFNGSRTARHDAGGNWFFFADHLGSARVMTWQNGITVEESDYYPFGGERVVVDTVGAPWDNNRKFTGQERDTESGL